MFYGLQKTMVMLMAMTMLRVMAVIAAFPLLPVCLKNNEVAHLSLSVAKEKNN